jgi:hypothetical protein
MPKNIEHILHVEDVKQNDVIVFNYVGKIERYIIQSIDQFAVRATSAEGRGSIRIFPVNNLISDNWYIEKESNSIMNA